MEIAIVLRTQFVSAVVASILVKPSNAVPMQFAKL